MPQPREKQPEFRRKRDLHGPLLTAMAQVLPFLKQQDKATRIKLLFGISPTSGKKIKTYF